MPSLPTNSGDLTLNSGGSNFGTPAGPGFTTPSGGQVASVPLDPIPGVQAQSSSAANLGAGIGGGIGTLLGGPVGGALVGGGLSLLGGLFQQNYNTQMADTSYQRAVADMEKAGLNPALMYGSGGPEAVPQSSNIGSAVTSSAGEGFQALLGQAQAQASIREANARADLTKASTAVTLAGALPEATATGKMYSKLPWIPMAEKALEGIGAGIGIGTGVTGISKLLSQSQNAARIPSLVLPRSSGGAVQFPNFPNY